MTKTVYSNAFEIARRSANVEFSEQIPRFTEFRESIPIVLYGRTSRGPQDRNGNTEDQVASMREVIEATGRTIIGEFSDPGCDGSRLDESRTGLIAARKQAKKHDAIVVVETACRALRSADFHPSLRPDVQPNADESRELFRFMYGVPIAQVYPSYFDWREARSIQSSRGQNAKGRKGGRPRKHYRPRWNKCLREVEKALNLRKAGRSYQEIADELGRHRATIQTWCRNYVYEFDEVCINGQA